MIDERPGNRGADEPDFPSGRWCGYYLYSVAGVRHRQELVLEFRRGAIRGTGQDDIGRFAISGRFDPVSREVSWLKTYPGSHAVRYRGFREGRGIWGVWQVDGSRGGFRIWPSASGDGAGEELGAEQDVPVPTPALSPA